MRPQHSKRYASDTKRQPRPAMLLLWCTQPTPTLSTLLGLRPVELPSSPCRICTRQGIPNAYHWTQLCPLRQPQFTCDLPRRNNSVSQCTGNSVISSQVTNGSENTANDRQNPSTEASGPVH
ncbi:hypothetical protein AVEN_138574-1 [Araneus ventricosus]|uniref:Uncharacterized protein n=1 Tax=Araneus ventricosus TaxID=182803 RepID=A0A4Y2IWD9_ARAVE|nr:hypothetical protein AVEN_138574-1 [Araneus ventricosus]